MSRYPARAPSRSSSAAGGVAAVDRALMILSAFRPGDKELTLAALAERTRLAQELHDTLEQSLTGIALQLGEHLDTAPIMVGS